MIAASQQFAVFLKAQIYWPRPKRLAIGLCTMNNPGQNSQL
jgi:hypothetical protein